MGLLISKADFISEDAGKYRIANTKYEDTIDSYIEKYEEKYLQQLMGVELFKLFKVAVSSPNSVPPTDPIYLAIYDPIAEDELTSNVFYPFYFLYDYCAPSCDRIRLSNGLREMLLGFIYFEYMRDQSYKPTSGGIVKNKNENSREASFDENGIKNRYNDAIDSYHTIQWYLFKRKTTDYPKFNGMRKQHIGLI